MKKIIGLYIFLFFSNWCLGINPQKITSYSVNDGLSINELTCLYQDRVMNYLWVASQNGLNRYDGHEFKVFKVPQGFSSTSNHINEIGEDSQQNLWLATKAGITCFNMITNTFFRPNGFPVKGNILHLVVLHDSLIIATTPSQNLLVFKKDEQEWTSDSLEVHDSYIHELSVVGDKCYLAASDGLLLFDVKANSLSLGDKGFQRSIRTIKYLPKDSALWVSDFKKIYYRIPYHLGELDFDEIQTFDFKEVPEMAETIYDVEFQKGIYWFSSHTGLLGIQKDNGTITTIKNSKDSYLKGLSEILFDNKGNLWCATWQVGLIKVANTPDLFRSYTINEAYKTNPIRFIRNFQQLPDGRILVITESDGIFLFNEVEETFRKFEDDLLKITQGNSNHYIHSSAIDFNDRMWLGFYHKGARILFGSNKREINNTLQATLKGSYTCDDILIDSINDKIYLGTNKGVFVYDEKNQSVALLDFIEKDIRTLLLDTNNNLWLGTRAGLFLLDKNHNLKLQVSESNKTLKGLSSIDITQIIQDSNHQIWLTTLGKGLFYFDQQTQKFVALVPPKHIQFDVVYSIIEDDFKTLWMGTNNGIIAYNLTEKVFKRYGIENGVLDHQFNYQSVLKSKDGHIYFGSLNGIMWFDPTLFYEEINIPQPIISSYHVGKQVVSFFELGKYKEIIELPFTENSFNIQFYCPDFTNSSHYLYAYKLEGYNNDWQYTNATNPQATFNNVKHGVYNLLVKVSLPNSQWSEVSTSPLIIIKPPFYLSTLAYLFYGFLVLVILVGLILVTRYQANMKNNLKIAELERINIEELSAAKLRFFTYIAHEIRTPLTLILSPLNELIKEYTFDHKVKLSLSTMKRSADKLQNLMGELLLFRKAEHGGLILNLQVYDVIELVHKVALLFDVELKNKGVVFSISYEEEVLKQVIDQEKIEIVLINLIGNALKFTDREGIITVSIKQVQGVLDICVADTGKGMGAKELENIFEYFYQVEAHDLQGFGIGLSLSKRIIEAHKGVMSVESNPSKGTIFSFIIPILTINIEEKQVYLSKSSVPLESVNDFRVKESIQGHILIVEDDLDIQTYVAGIFENQFKVSVKNDGQEALNFIKEELPDVIISDYQMPNMNGVDMTYALKNDLLTSHIPVLLLSGFYEVEDQIQGLKVGANDYIAKPFDKTVLRYKIQNLLEVKQKFIRSFNDDIGLNFVALGETDKQFLKELNSLIKENMSSQKVDVSFLCEALMMGKSKLNYKLKSLLEITPAEYIKKIRLKEAYRLLNEEKKNVAETAYATGFSPSYFNTSFKKEFGIPPGTLV